MVYAVKRLTVSQWFVFGLIHTPSARFYLERTVPNTSNNVSAHIFYALFTVPVERVLC